MMLHKAIEGFFISRRADNIADTTLAIYRHYLRLFAERIGDVEMDRIDADQVVAFAAWLQTEYVPQRLNGDTAPLAASSLANAWSAVRSLFGWAERRLNTGRPDRAWQRPRVQYVTVQPFSEEEMRRMLDAAQFTRPAATTRRTIFRMKRPMGKRDKAIVLLLLDTGIRASELCRLRVEDVDLNSGIATVRPHGTRQKTHGRAVFLSKRTIEAVWDYLASRTAHPADPLFIKTDGLVMDRMRLAHLVKRIGLRAGVEGAYPHRFRHTFAIQYLRNGGDPFTLQRLLGHRDMDMVRRYLALADDDAQRAHKTASPVDRWRL